MPTCFISSVTGYGLTELKDLLWTELNSESNKLQTMLEGGSIVHRDREAATFNADFADWQDDIEVAEEDDDLEELDVYDLEDLEEVN